MTVSGGEQAAVIVLEIDSCPQDVVLVEQAGRALCALTPLAAGTVERLMMAVVEAVDNAIAHGYEGRPGFPITVRWTFEAERLAIAVSDRGKPFAGDLYDPMPEPGQEGGRGLPLMQAGADELKLRADGETKTIELIKRFTG